MALSIVEALCAVGCWTKARSVEDQGYTRPASPRTHPVCRLKSGAHLLCTNLVGGTSMKDEFFLSSRRSFAVHNAIDMGFAD